MKYLYLKGMSTTKEEFEIIKDKFMENGMELINLVDDYADFYGMRENEIKKELIKRINSYTGDKCLICHSMGCNFGVIVAPHIRRLAKIMFISPEWKDVTKEEQRLILPSSNETKYPSHQQPLSINKIKNITVFVKSKNLYQKNKIENKTMFNYLFLSDLCKDIFYSKGDKFVSRKEIESLSAFENVNVFEIDTNNHNPILETDDIVLRAKEILNYSLDTDIHSCELLDSFQNNKQYVKTIGTIK